jgi:glucose-1-phosphate thymidylyltransferase
VNFAIIDATASAPGQPLCSVSSSRYTTPIANAPLIRHVYDELAAGGIEDACVIAAPETQQELERSAAGGGHPTLTVSYRAAALPDLRHAVLAEVQEALARGPVLLHPGDSLFCGQVAAMSERFGAGDVDTVLPVQASVELLHSPAQRRASDTIVVLGPATRPLVEDLLSPQSEDQDLIASLLHSDCRLAVCDQTEHWAYSDTTEALLAANRLMLDALPDVGRPTGYSENNSNRMQGRIAISSTAFVSNCVIYGPVSIADGAVVEDSFLGPYTAVGPGAVLSGTEIDNAMVLAGGEIRHPGSRIEASIIGEGARVTRGFELPSGLHMRLGPDSRITLS